MDDDGAPNEKTGFEDVSAGSAEEGVSASLSTDGVDIEADGRGLKELGFVGASDVVGESEACLLAAPKMLMLGVGASATFGVPKEKGNLDVSDPFACPLGSPLKGEEA